MISAKCFKLAGIQKDERREINTSVQSLTEYGMDSKAASKKVIKDLLREAEAEKNNIIEFIRKNQPKPEKVEEKPAEEVVDKTPEKEYKESEISEKVNPYEDKQQKIDFKFKEKEPTKGIPASKRVRMATTGRIKAASRVVGDVDGAASLLSHIRKSAQEIAYTITVDKDGTVLEVHRYSKGKKGAAMVSPMETAGRILNISDADTAYFIHNHPSGSTTPSAEDSQLVESLEKMLELKDVKLKSLIISGTKYREISTSGETLYKAEKTIKPTRRSVELPEKERALAGSRPGLPKLNDPQMVKEYFKNVLNGQEGSLFMDAQNRPIGFLKFTPGEKQKTITADIVSTGERLNATRFVFNSNVDIFINTKRKRFLKALGKQMTNRGFRTVSGDLPLLDIISAGNSLGEAGLIDAFATSAGTNIDTKGNYETIGSGVPLYSTKTTFKDSDISIEDIQSIFKGQKVGIAPDSTIFVKTKLGRGVQIKSVETITPDETAFEVGYSRMKASGELIAGKYQDGVITISKVGDRHTLSHESEHFLEDAGFINKNDQKAISGEIKRRVKKGTWKTLNPDDIGGKEDRAEFIAQELKTRSDSRPAVQRVIQKIQDLIDAFINLYKRTARGVVRDVRSGKIYEKEGVPEIKQKALREGMPMFMVAGKKAIGAPTGALNKAQKMLADGKSKDEVWKETGWLEGAEGAWKWEIDDSKAKLKNIKVDSLGIAEKHTYLGDILEHSELFKNYPEISNMLTTIMIDKDMKNPRGSYTSRVEREHEGLVDIEPETTVYAKNVDQAKNTLFHEIQHAVQEIEGFAEGGSPKTMAQELVNSETRHLLKTDDTYADLAGYIDELYFQGERHDSFKVQQYRDQMQKIFDKHLDKKYGEDPSLKLYKRLAGEIEARDTAARIDLTPAQRGQNFNKVKGLWEQAQKTRQTDKYKAEEKEWIASDKKDADLKKRNEAPAHKKLYAIEDEIMDMGYNLNQKLVRNALSGDKSAQNILIQPLYESQGIPESDWIIKKGDGTSFSVKEGKPEQYSTKKPDLDPDIKELLNKLMPEAEAKKFKKPDDLPRDPKKPNIIKEKFGRTEKTPKEAVIEAVEGVKTKEFWDKVATKTLDRLHPIKTFLSDKAYKLHRIETGTQAVLSMFLEHGKLKWDDSGFLTMDERKHGFLPFLKSLGKDWDKFIYWTAVKRAENLSKQGRERWLDKEAREEIFEWAGGKNNSKWVEASKEFKEFNSNVLDIAEKAGLIDPEGRKIWEQEFYVPFYRIFEDFTTRDEFLKAPRKNKRFISAQIQRLKGANAKMGDPLENLMHNWTHLINESLRNVSRAEAFDFAVKNDLDIIEEVGVKDINSFRSSKDKKTVYVTKNTQENVLMFQRGGKPIYFKVSEPELFHAMSNVNAKHLDNFVVQLAGKAKRALTFGATFGPGFRVANLLRDTMHTAMINKSFKPFYDSAIGFKKSWMEDAEYVSLMASGAGFGSSYVRADDPKTLNKYIKRIIKKEGDGALKLILNTPKKMLDFWEKVGSASENAARVQLYSNLLSDGKTHTEAAFEARDLLDFTMRGESGTVQLLIQTIPFLNARMQGLYKLGRAVADKENTKNFAIRGAMLTAASLSLWALYRDDDRWKELEDWDKWSYYHFWIGDKHFRIPKPFEVGAIFSSFPETMADVLYGNEETKHIADFIGYTARENFAIGVPQLFSPIMEQWANKSSFTGRPIVGQHLKGLKPGEQKDPWTSETVQLIAGKMNISPKRAEALINSYFSTFGMFVLSGSDIVTRNAFDFPERPARRIDDYPLVGRFIKESKPARHTKYTTWFYETLRDIDESTKTLNHFKQTGDFGKARDLIKTDTDKLIWKKVFSEYRGHLSQTNRRMKHILLDKKYTADQKREKIDKLVTRRNELIKRLYEAYGKRKK